MNKGAKQLSEEIANRGLRQAEAASFAGCTPSFMSHLLHGRKRPGRRLAAKLFEIFDVRTGIWDEEIGSGSESGGTGIEVSSTEAGSRGENQGRP